MFSQPPKPLNSQKNAIFSTRLNSPQALNRTLLTNFLKRQDDANVRKTHLFGDRYENIYLNDEHIPELGPLIKHIVTSAESVLNIQNLRAGYWFNYMPPGSTTTLHTHDDDDELLSGVYYIHVPENSGNLVIYENTRHGSSNKIEITPCAGELIFFKPDARHEVTENLSNEHRLSIGLNFGKPDNENTL